MEDDPNIRSVVSTLLETEGYRVIWADTCQLSLSLFASHRPDAVILDLGLPDMDGMRFLEHVRRDSLTPIIVLSARSNDRDKVTALDAGANDYVTKPFSSIVALLSEHCGKMMTYAAIIKGVWGYPDDCSFPDSEEYKKASSAFLRNWLWLHRGKRMPSGQS